MEPTEESRRDDDARSGDRRPLLPDRSGDDTDEGWGERREENDERLIADRPPHWG